MKKSTIDIIVMVLFVCVLLGMIIQLFPLLEDVIENRHDESSVASYVDALGWRGPVSLVGLTALQVVLPIIPAAATGVLTGLSYGVLWGPLIFLGGIAIGNIFVIFVVRRIDNIFAKRIKHNPTHKSLLSKEKLDRIKRPEIVAFFLFMIPFISGAGPYLFAETKIKLWKYIIAVLAGSLPTTILYVFLGDQISQGSYTSAIVMGSIVVVALVVILVFRKKIITMIMDGSGQDTESDQDSIQDS